MYGLIFILSLIVVVKSDIECFHPTINLSFTSVHQVESMNIRSKRSPQNLRITRYYDSSYTSMDNSDYVTKFILDPAVQFWQNSLLVNNPLSSPLIVDRKCTDSYSYKTVGTNRIKVCTSACDAQQLCYNTVIPNQYLQSCFVSTVGGGYSTTGSMGAGAANTDLLLIVTQLQSGCTGTVLAYAVACELEYTLDRPVLGLINICPGRVNAGVGQTMAISTIKHEIAHILGMSSNLYAFWRNQSGFPLTPRNGAGIPNLGLKRIAETTTIYQYSNLTIRDYVKTFNYPTGTVSTTVSYIVTPTVQNEIRTYFNCPTLEGMMLEGYGTSASILSHFEKLYLQNELMTASISVNSLASRLTLAVLQDTGWYIVNFIQAENFVFAKGIGCPFVTSSCFDYMKLMQSSGQTLAPYCNQAITVGGLSCSTDLTSLMFCNLQDNADLGAATPAQFRYFSNTNLVSTDPYSDYCPVILVYAMAISNNYIYTGQCTDPQNKAVQGTINDYFNQGFGLNSMCVGFSKPNNWYHEMCKSVSAPSIQGAGCFQYICDPTYGLIIVVNNFQYQCTTVNTNIDVTSNNNLFITHGKLVCPDCNAVCGAALCNSAKGILPVKCNNVDRLCPGVTRYNVPCPTPSRSIGLMYNVPFIIISSSLLLLLFDVF